MTRLLQALTLVLAAVVSAAGCGAQTGNKAGGPAAPVVLRMASVNGEAGYNPAVDELLKRVEAQSNGNVKIEMAFRCRRVRARRGAADRSRGRGRHVRPRGRRDPRL